MYGFTYSSIQSVAFPKEEVRHIRLQKIQSNKKVLSESSVRKFLWFNTVCLTANAKYCFKIFIWLVC